jgi:hypothetical protein
MELASRFPVFAVSVALGCLSCSSGDERPAAQRDPSIEQASEEAASEATAGADGADASDADTDAAPPQACVPGATQDCRLYYEEPPGIWHCPLSYQICKSDGSGFWPCGAQNGHAVE